MTRAIIWTSDPMTIGRHQWRVGVETRRLVDGSLARCTFYEWRHPVMCGAIQPWHPDREFRGYDDHKGDNGLPRTLARLYERESDTIRALIDGPTYRTELTAAGEQAVIPGCEKNESPKVRQLDLFG